jgi:glycosyltransferase involved in cell wall biosynthesis
LNKQNDLDIVLPCFNPKAGWADRVVGSYLSIKTLLPDTIIGLIVVNDGSNENMDYDAQRSIHDQVDSLNFIDYAPNKGKGYALRRGIQASSAPFCIYTDVDFPYEESSLVKIYRAFQKGNANVVVGVRNAEYYNHVPRARIVISKIFRWMIRNILSLSITDTQGGLKGFDAYGRSVFLCTTINRYLFDLQFVYLASRENSLRIIPVEVKLKSDVTFSRMNLKILITEFLNFLKILLS